MKAVIRTTLALVSITMFTVLLALSPAWAAEPAAVKIPVKADLYASDPPPLTPQQCGQCHGSYFSSLKADGGKHRFECQQCHQTFHAYNPTKGIAAYQALMPKCDSCHRLPHGKTITDCANCHVNPHAIKQPVTGARLAKSCGECHPGPKAELAQNPSKHTKVACDSCHTSHGFIPNCNMCHKAHYPEQGFDTCTTCHKVHKPKLVTYGADTADATCVSCHGQVAATLHKSPTKHASVTCVACHQAKHKAIPQCAECHEAPHSPAILTKFPVCLTCHVNPHDLLSTSPKK